MPSDGLLDQAVVTRFRLGPVGPGGACYVDDTSKQGPTGGGRRLPALKDRLWTARVNRIY